MKLLTIFLSFCCFLINTHNAFSTTLEEAIKKTSENNQELQLEKLRLDTIKATKGDAISEFLPDVRATYQKGRQQNDATSLNRGKSDKMSDQNTQKISVNQPIFNGFASYNKAKEIGYNISQASEYFQAKKGQITLSAIEAYLNLYNARKLVEIKNRNVENLTESRRLLEDRNRLGQVGTIEVAIYSNKLLQEQLEAINQQKVLIKAKEEYQQIIGNIDEDLSILKLDLSKIPKSEEEIIGLVISNNASLKQYEFKIKSSKSALDQTKGEFLPKAEISASMSKEKNVTYLDNSDLNSRAVYLNVSIPIFQKGKEYFNLNKAGKELSLAKQERKFNLQTLEKEARQTNKELLLYDNFIKNQESAIELTKSKIQQVSQQVKLGQGDILDLLASKLELNMIIEQYLQYQAEYTLRYYKLLSLMGRLEV